MIKKENVDSVSTMLLKKLLYFIIGIITYPGLCLFNKLKINGMEKLHALPKRNVLFVSNHHTYFADVITFLHIFCAVSWGKKKGLGIPYYLLWPFVKVRYVAAETTMKSTLLARIFTLAGAITVKRTWNAQSGEVRKGLEAGDTRSITRALKENWIITFPQGTTTPFAPGRKGTAFIIKHDKPIVVPVVINGFSDTFSKNGLKIKKWLSKLEVTFKEPMVINYEDSTEVILHQVMTSIEQIK
jgi:1-acyl-sn-glycerol-3-phosphate acyltransferase